MPKRGKRVKKASAPRSYGKTIELLIENNISLQRKLVNLTESIDNMNRKIGRLLHLIEIASEEVVKGETSEKGMNEKKGRDDLIDKLEGLIKQNKTIARGLLLLERYVREKAGGSPREEEEFKPLPEFKF